MADGCPGYRADELLGRLDGSIVIHPALTELVGPEIAMLNGFTDRHWMCWPLIGSPTVGIADPDPVGALS
ncbi:hypothetical protein GCM10011588_22440 [Nocardia jinanensis]|uniref:Uncharacterized protein n=1 Tax=Nocardia jinanensis TaxID=382504 RepID=A0A917RHH2_9NOCA|nr:hypothetical protein GCM10011588_22440 [Nocardia jinanensis]